MTLTTAAMRRSTRAAWLETEPDNPEPAHTEATRRMLAPAKVQVVHARALKITPTLAKAEPAMIKARMIAPMIRKAQPFMRAPIQADGPAHRFVPVLASARERREIECVK